MKRLLNFLRRMKLAHDAWVIETEIEVEEERNRTHLQRMRVWRAEVARLKGEIACLDADRKRAQYQLSGIRPRSR